MLRRAFPRCAALVLLAATCTATADVFQHAYVSYAEFGSIPVVVSGGTSASVLDDPFARRATFPGGSPAFVDNDVRGSITNRGDEFIKLYAKAYQERGDVTLAYVEAGWSDEIMLPASYAWRPITLSFAIDGFAVGARTLESGIARIQVGDQSADFGNLNHTDHALAQVLMNSNGAMTGSAFNWDFASWTGNSYEASFLGTSSITLYPQPVFGPGGGEGPQGPVAAREGPS